MTATCYARSGSRHIAYQVVGEGPFDLLLVSSWFSNIEVLWESPMVARFLERLASFSRLVLFDRRGSGLSDSCPPSELRLDDRAADAIAVLDAVDSERATVLGTFLGGALAIHLAAHHPDRVSALTLYNATAAFDPDDEVRHARVATAAADFTPSWGRSSFGLSNAISEHHAEWWQRYQRMSLGPGDAAASMSVIAGDDVRPLLSRIRVPTLVAANTRGPFVAPASGRYLAEHIDGARFLEFASNDPGWLFHPDDPVLDEVQEFLIGSRAELQPDRQLATVLFTDLIGSTPFAASAGDTGWRDAIQTHDQMLVSVVERHGGTVIKTTGDGALVTFDRPSTAIRCARALATEADRLGFAMRLGIHAGEIDHVGKDVAGLAVVIAERTMQLASANQVVVTNTVRDLLIGSSVSFEDEGTHSLKGVPGEWHIWRVASEH